MKIIKKNQLTILVLALMLVTAGYLNYNNTVETSEEIASIGDATLVSSNLSNRVTKQLSNEIQNSVTNNDKEDSISKTNESTLQTNTKQTNVEEYFTSSRLERDTMYSQMLESYQKILRNTNVTEKQKQASQEEIDKINKIKNAIMISENLIKSKGFDDVVIFVNDDSISVVIDKEELEKEDIAQIQSIIAREMEAKIENIHIMNK